MRLKHSAAQHSRRNSVWQFVALYPVLVVLWTWSQSVQSVNRIDHRGRPSNIRRRWLRSSILYHVVWISDINDLILASEGEVDSIRFEPANRGRR